MLSVMHRYFPVMCLFITSSIKASSADDCSSELKAAISNNDLESIKQSLVIYSVGRKKSHITQREWKIACIAAEVGNLNVTKFISERNPTIIQRRNDDNLTLAHIAAENGHSSLTEYWIQCHELLLSMDDKWSLFHIAAKKGYLNVIQCLDKKYTHISMEDRKSAAKNAADNGHLDIACFLAASEDYYCKDFTNIIQTAIKRSHKRDEKTLKLIVELATKWNEWGSFHCPKSIISLASAENDTKLLQHFAEKKCRLFLEEEGLDIVFRHNITNEKFLECLVENGALFREIDYSKNTICHAAAKYDCLNVIQFMVDRDTSLIEKKNYQGKTFFHIAAEKGCADIIRYAVRKKPSAVVGMEIAHYSNLYRRPKTIFIWAIQNNYIDIDTLKYLCETKAVQLTMVRGVCGETLGHIAAYNGKMNILQYIVEKWPSILFAVDGRNDTILHILASKHKLASTELEFYVNKGAPLTVKNRDCDTVAHIFAKQGNITNVEYLVEKEPSILTIGDQNGDTVLHILAREHILSVKSFSFFIDKGAPLFMNNKKSDNVALIATRKGNLPILEIMVQKRNSAFANESIKLQISESAASHGHLSILEFLVEKIPTFLAQRPKILFKLPNETEVFKILRHLKTKCEKDIHNWDIKLFESEILHNVIEYDYRQIFTYMKYDVNMMNEKGEPFIFTAIRRKRPNIFYCLATDSKINLTALDSEGNNILFIAAQSRDLDKMKYILDTLKAPISLEWRNNKGDTLLHVAVYEALAQTDEVRDDSHNHQAAESSESHEQSHEQHRDDISVIEYLVEQKHADVNALGSGNKTVLHHTTSRMNYYISNYLLDHGANPELQDLDGQNFWKTMHFPTPIKDT